MNDTVQWTEERLDALGPGRELDVLIETKLMGRKVEFMKGDPCAWDGNQKPIMYTPNDWQLADYDPQKDGISIHSGLHNPKTVFRYSDFDFGMVRVMDRLRQGKDLCDLKLMWTHSGRWTFYVTWYAGEEGKIHLVKGADALHPRLAVYRGALKAVIL